MKKNWVVLFFPPLQALYYSDKYSAEESFKERVEEGYKIVVLARIIKEKVRV